MKQNQNNRRQRPRGNGRKYPNQRGGSFESSGPEAKVRGTAQQVLEKYQALARDAYSAGDRILAEGYLQHAEHYYRIINLENENAGRDNNRPRPNNSNRDDDADSDDQNDDNNNHSNEQQPQHNENQPQRSERRPPRNDQNGNGPNRRRPRDGNDDQRETANDQVETPVESVTDNVMAIENPADDSEKAQAPKKPRQRRPRKVEQPASDPTESSAAD